MSRFWPARQWRRGRRCVAPRAFTLIELLVVVAIIAVLISILLPSLNRARRQARRVKCGSNIRQLMVACCMHAEEHHRGIYVATNGTGSDSLAHIYPTYLPDPKIALCPATNNRIREYPEEGAILRASETRYRRDVLQDLAEAAEHGRDDTGGHSFEVWGWFDGRVKYLDGTVIDGYQVGTIPQQLGLRPEDDYYLFWAWSPDASTTHVVKRHGVVRTPAKVNLILDNDQGPGWDPSGEVNVNNWPDASDNHAPYGLNIGYLDGHVAWQDRNAKLIDLYLESYNEPPSVWVDVHEHLRGKYGPGGVWQWFYR